MSLDLIFTRSRILLSKTTKDWRLWQDQYNDFVTSLSFESTGELLSYLRMEYNLSDVSVQKLSAEMTLSDSQTIVLKF